MCEHLHMPSRRLERNRRRWAKTAAACWRRLGRFVILAAVAAIGVSTVSNADDKTTDANTSTGLEYPMAHRSDHADNYHGTTVPDPYRWLEDPDSEPTRAWVDAQVRLTTSYLEPIQARGRIQERLTELWDYERYSAPSARGGRYFYSHNDGLQNQSVLYVANSADAEGRVLLDPNTLSEDGTVALSGYAISDDGALMAYGLSSAGSDWQEWRVRDVETGKDLDDHLKWVKFSGASWTPDGRGFYYSRYNEPAAGEELTGANYFQKLYFHRIGTPQSADRLVYHRDDEKEWGFDGEVTEDGRYLIVSVWRGTERKNQVFYFDLAHPDAKIVELIAGFEAEYSFLGNEGPVFWFRTDLDAPRYRVVAIDTSQPQRAAWEDVIPQADDTLQGASVVGNRFFASYLTDAHSRVRVFDLEGQSVGEVDLPPLATAGGFTGLRKHRETFYGATSFTTPTEIYRYDLDTGESQLVRRPDVAIDRNAFEARQVFYTSRDGTRVPMYLIHKRGIALDGRRPTILYGYGGFNIALTPAFSVTRSVWLEMGGVYAVANLRGGGEYGRPWHEAGMLDKKQNVFDDFIAAAEWLIENDYTSSDRLAISGGSNGGLLVGACVTQRPDLFGAAMPDVGVMDMLRFQKFTIGWAWVSEYGSSDDAEQFETLHAYSPLHNLRPGTSYPATLISTADHDDRVVPAHSYKFAATMQAAQCGPAPILIRIETQAGHGAGTPTTKAIEEWADRLAFLVKVFEMKVP